MFNFYEDRETERRRLINSNLASLELHKKLMEQFLRFGVHCTICKVSKIKWTGSEYYMENFEIKIIFRLTPKAMLCRIPLRFNRNWLWRATDV